MPGLTRMLISAGADVNVRLFTSSFKRHLDWLGARMLVLLGNTSSLILEVATHEGATPLMLAAREGKTLEVSLLLAAAAEPELRNRQGLTALDLSRLAFRGVIPSYLEELLTSIATPTPPLEFEPSPPPEPPTLIEDFLPETQD